MNSKPIKKEFFSIWMLLVIFVVLAIAVVFLWMGAVDEIPENVGRELSADETQAIIDANSPLTEYVYLSPNADFPRKGKISKITIHHMAGDIELEELGQLFSYRDRKASANYAIDKNGRVALYVEECNRAWTSSNKENDDMAVTIEVANDELNGDWHVSDESYAALIELCADICRRNDINKLVYTGDARGNLTVHKMFKPETECPGPYLLERMPDIAKAVNAQLE